MKIAAEKLDQLFDSFQSLRVLIIGDVMLDSYYWGSVDRISPEAPVPIVSVNQRESRMGGAANVALNIQALGASPILCSVIGKDEAGKEFLTLVEKNKQSQNGILQVDHRKTTQKTRIIGNNHQMLRIDAEETMEIDAVTEATFINLIKNIIEKERVDVILFEDYDKGTITPNLIKKVIEFSQKMQIPTAVDPKKRNFLAFKNVTLFKPNVKELKEGLKIDFDHRNQAELEDAILQLEQKLNNEITLITLSEAGVYIKSKNRKQHVKAHHRDITDVSGAGDTVISVAGLCLALKVELELLAELSNLAGGLVCENVGVVPIERKSLLEESKRIFSDG